MGTIEYMSYLRCSMAGDFEEELLQHLLRGKDFELIYLLSNLEHQRTKRWLRAALISLLAFRGRDANGSMSTSSISVVSRKLVSFGLPLTAERVEFLESSLLQTAKDLDPLFCEQVNEAWHNLAMSFNRSACATLPVIGGGSRNSTQMMRA